MKRLSISAKTISDFGLRCAVAILTAAFFVLAPSAASAHCAAPGAASSGFSPRMPFAVTVNQNTTDKDDANGQKHPSIVGLWHVTFTSGGELFLETFDQWHRDGTEFENANAPAVEGNICLGVWKQIGPRTVKLHHIGWNFDASGNSIGTFTIDEIDTLSPDGKQYHGTFDFKVFDVDGNLALEVTGETSATRITVN